MDLNNKHLVPVCVLIGLILVGVIWFMKEKPPENKFKIKLPKIEVEIDRPMDKIDE
jgi:hypothetical protein